MSATITEYVAEYEWPEGENADEPTRTEKYEREHDVTPDEIDREEGFTTVDLAHRLLCNAGVYEASSYPEWQPRTWYIATYENPYTGVIQETTYHPAGLTEQESRELFTRIMGGH